jgi:hypothetical protein
MQQEHLSKRQEMQQQQLDLYEHWLVEKAKSVFKHKVGILQHAKSKTSQ